jgi:hypothetical protein
MPTFFCFGSNPTPHHAAIAAIAGHTTPTDSSLLEAEALMEAEVRMEAAVWEEAAGPSAAAGPTGEPRPTVVIAPDGSEIPVPVPVPIPSEGYF